MTHAPSNSTLSCVPLVHRASICSILTYMDLRRTTPQSRLAQINSHRGFVSLVGLLVIHVLLLCSTLARA
eukprot:m.284264 g.284264  ORF g.284264 m.284264 type:complete len:70 (-) comp15761_c2_seq14:1960-2169(-)